tara:strand:- start:477 stop:707 length:231 start_codon:yes stop_codon:yes gene_type:complete
MIKEFTDRICDVEVQVKFKCVSYFHADDIGQFGMRDIEDITFFINEQDVTEIVWEMQNFDELFWINRCLIKVNEEE